MLQRLVHPQHLSEALCGLIIKFIFGQPDYCQSGVLLQGLCKALPSLRGDAIECKTRKQDTGDGLLHTCPLWALPSMLSHLGSFYLDTAPGRKQESVRAGLWLFLKRPGRNKGRTQGFAFELKAKESWCSESGLGRA